MDGHQISYSATDCPQWIIVIEIVDVNILMLTNIQHIACCSLIACVQNINIFHWKVYDNWCSVVFFHLIFWYYKGLKGHSFEFQNDCLVVLLIALPQYNQLWLPLSTFPQVKMSQQYETGETNLLIISNIPRIGTCEVI